MSSYRATIGFDYSHNNKLTLEASSYSDFFQFLFASGYKVGKIQAGLSSSKTLKDYDAIVLSTPRNTKLAKEEIENLIEYSKNGGSLLIISSSGGDPKNKTNLNELTRNFGFEFNSDEINDSMSYAKLQKRPLISNFSSHVVTEQIEKVVFSSACSLKIFDYIEEIKEINIEELVKSGLNSWHKVYDGNDWYEEDFPKIPMMIAVEFHEGKILAFGGLSLFSSLGREYGFFAYDNDILIGNILKWLTMDIESSEGDVITINLNSDLYHWADKIVKEKNWDNLSNLINVGMKHFKDNYDEIMNKVVEQKEKKKEDFKKIERSEEKEEEDDSIYDLIPERKKEDLFDIIDEISKLTGEEYEYSIDFDEVEENEGKKKGKKN
ncbi:MAG: hypothetical protein EU521_00915 [Promethearchaeota archaeon]|nr:MAG: hypothetical protein EU521_00915 [Candidatus Lokiarchaeota archaeon]